MTALSSPTRLNTSSLQTLLDQEMLETFLQSHRFLTALRLQRPRFDSIQRSTPNDNLYNSLLQANADHEGSCQQFFSLSKRVLCLGYSRR